MFNSRMMLILALFIHIQINELSTASNEKRLALLRDVSGSSVSQELHVKDVSNLQGKNYFQLD